MIVRDSGPHVAQHLQSRVESLKAALDAAQARIDELEQALGIGDDLLPLRELGLTPHEARFVNLLSKREVATRDQVLIAMYADDDERRFDVRPDIVNVICCNARRKLRKHDITLGSIFKPGMRSDGGGYRMPSESKAKLRSLISTRGVESRAMNG